MLFATACGPMTSDAPKAEGYARCMAASAHKSFSLNSGAISLEGEKRTLTIKRKSGAVRLALFTGTAPFRSGVDEAVQRLSRDRADAIVVLGNLGDGTAIVTHLLSALASLDIPVLIVPGARDDADELARALKALGEAHERFIDLSLYERVVIGDDVLVPIAGGPENRFARTPRACGYSGEDLDERVAATSTGEKKRVWLLSWAGPDVNGAGISGLRGGVTSITRAEKRLDAKGAIYAWPRENSGHVVESRYFAVPSIAGTRGIGARDSTQNNGYALWTLGGSALDIVTRF